MKSVEQWLDVLGCRVGIDKYTLIGLRPHILEIQAEAYEAGQRDMREVAANNVSPWDSQDVVYSLKLSLAKQVRALPIKLTESSKDA